MRTREGVKLSIDCLKLTLAELEIALRANSLNADELHEADNMILKADRYLNDALDVCCD